MEQIMPNTIPSDAAKAVLDVIWEQELDGELPVDPVKIANKLGYKVYESHAVSPGGGETDVVDGEFAIFVNPTDSAVRRRFTISHELGHIILGHYSGEPMHRTYGIPTSQEEIDADTFAAELLMPESYVRGMVMSSCSFNKLLKTFNTSTPAMSRRLRELGLA